MSMTTAPTTRQHFTQSRAIEYFQPRELETQTGQLLTNFASAVAPKELIDNALDAAEAAGRSPVIEITAHLDDDGTHLSVGDNGNGLAPAIVTRILNFDSRTSDKAAYRGPCRGAQGNALKTLIGMPTALGAERGELEITAQGVRHRIIAWVDPAQMVRIEHDPQPEAVAEGTRITLRLPGNDLTVAKGLDRLAWAYHALNPHATVRISLSGTAIYHDECLPTEIAHSYHPTAIPGWTKYRANDPEAAAWHDADSFARLVQLTIHAGDLPLRAFVRQFRGLTGTAKAKAVCDALPWTRLGELDGDAEGAAQLLTAMQGQAAAPAPTVLGIIGEDHLRQALSARFTLVPGRFWYKRTLGTAPFICEVALSEIRENVRERLFGLNFSPAYDDPFVGTWFETEERVVKGLDSFLSLNHANRQRYALIVHLTAPGLRFLDRGKTRLNITDEGMVEGIQRAIATVLKTFREEGKKAEADARKQARADERREDAALRPGDRVSLRDAVFLELARAVRLASGDDALPASIRTVYYKVRPLIAKHTTAELGYTYFSQTLVPDYEARFGKLRNLYADPRGMFHQPHDGVAWPIGDRAIEGFQFPDWQFDKILFVEKKGLYPILKAARLMERYDLAIIAGEGFSSVAIRTLLDRASQRQMRIFVLHDCDVDGYNIARTLGEATRRMPGHHLEVIDLGLRLADAQALDLEHEDYTRKKDLPDTLTLTEAERAFFIHRQTGKKQWAARRVELNALSSGQLIALIERGLKEHHADGKLIPPAKVVLEHGQETIEQLILERVNQEIARQLDIPAIRARVLRTIKANRLRPGRLLAAIDNAFNPGHRHNQPGSAHRALERPWTAPLEDHLVRHIQSTDLSRHIELSVRSAVKRQHIITARRAGQ